LGWVDSERRRPCAPPHPPRAAVDGPGRSPAAGSLLSAVDKMSLGGRGRLGAVNRHCPRQAAPAMTSRIVDGRRFTYTPTERTRMPISAWGPLERLRRSPPRAGPLLEESSKLFSRSHEKRIGFPAVFLIWILGTKFHAMLVLRRALRVRGQGCRSIGC
jgi:hypothetical protein